MSVEQTLSNGVSICKSKASDLRIIARNMREADRMEVLAHSGSTPIEALLSSVKASGDNCWTVFHNNKPAFIFGVAPVDESIGCPWMLGTDLMDAFKIEFIRSSKPIVDKLYNIRPTLYNTVWKHNSLHIRWLKWLGFKFSEEPINGFYHFIGGK